MSNKFYFIKPNNNTNPSVLAMRLMALSNVKEVLVTDGDYGYIVKTRFVDDKTPDNVERYLLNKVGAKYGKCISYYEYKRVVVR